MNNVDFKAKVEQSYNFEAESIILGTSVLGGEAINNNLVKMPFKSFTRHGLVTGATGTGKTKTIQVLAENLSENGVPVLLMDMKGDLSGVAKPGNPHPKIDERHEKIGIPFEPQSYPVELLTISDEPGARLRSTVLEFGPVLFSKLLQLNETQQSIIAILFKYADDENLPIIDLEDMKKLIQYATNEGKEELKKLYGNISTTSASTILRKIIELESQGGDEYFGELSFDTADLMRINTDGKAFINIIRLTDIQDKPKMISTFMLSLLAEVYNVFPEEGDMDKPKLVIFIEEAHLIFDNASPALLDQIEMTVKLIRSKGVGIFFVTQNVTDIPDVVLSQLGTKIQHSLRASSAKDRKNIKLISQNFPESDYYEVDKLITDLGIGEALVTTLDEKGKPTELVHTLLRAPKTRMDVLEDSEISTLVENSVLTKKYSQVIDPESAHEILSKKIEERFEEKKLEEKEKVEKKEKKKGKKSKSMFERVAGNALNQAARTVTREILRGFFGKMSK